MLLVAVGDVIQVQAARAVRLASEEMEQAVRQMPLQVKQIRVLVAAAAAIMA
jgi:hypothetical protein